MQVQNKQKFLFHRLKTIDSFLIQFKKNKTFFGSGKGSIFIEQKEDAIVFHETGTWQNLENTSFNFTNTYRFYFEKENLTIEHQRSKYPVFLSRLVCKNKDLFISEKEYICKQDHYMATLEIKEDALHLIWDITGPNKNDQVHYTYYAEN